MRLQNSLLIIGGCAGWFYFKFFMVAFVCILTQIIAIKKEETARWVLNFAIVVVAGVVIYSLTLLLRNGLSVIS